MTFAPDDFAGRPCVAGLNQMGHAVAGSAIVSVAPLPVAMLAICAWEVWQFKRRGATAADLKLDVAYWLAGAIGWHLAIAYGHVTGLPVYAPLCVLGLFVIEYARVAKWKN